MQRRKEIWQPVDRNTGKRADADDARFDPVHPADLRLHLAVIAQNFPQKRHQRSSGRGQTDAGLAALQERLVPFLLQIRDHFADGGLRIIQLLRGAGKAALFRRFDKGQIFQQWIFHRFIIPFFDAKYL